MVIFPSPSLERGQRLVWHSHHDKAWRALTKGKDATWTCSGDTWPHQWGCGGLLGKTLKLAPWRDSTWPGALLWSPHSVLRSQPRLGWSWRNVALPVQRAISEDRNLLGCMVWPAFWIQSECGQTHRPLSSYFNNLPQGHLAHLYISSFFPSPSCFSHLRAQVIVLALLCVISNTTIRFPLGLALEDLPWVGYSVGEYGHEETLIRVM